MNTIAFGINKTENLAEVKARTIQCLLNDIGFHELYEQQDVIDGMLQPRRRASTSLFIGPEAQTACAVRAKSTSNAAEAATGFDNNCPTQPASVHGRRTDRIVGAEKSFYSASCAVDAARSVEVNIQSGELIDVEPGVVCSEQTVRMESSSGSAICANEAGRSDEIQSAVHVGQAAAEKDFEIDDLGGPNMPYIQDVKNSFSFHSIS